MAAWYPGTMGAEAIARLLMGEANPSGHLSMTWMAHCGQVPIHHDCLTTGRPYQEGNPYVSKYLDGQNTPLFHFGHGLSYTSFCIEVKSAPAVLKCNDLGEIRCIVTNEGKMAGETVIQCYARAEIAPILQPEKRLIAFRRVALKAGENQEITLPISHKMLYLYNRYGEVILPQGRWNFAIGESSNVPYNLAI